MEVKRTLGDFDKEYKVVGMMYLINSQTKINLDYEVILGDWDRPIDLLAVFQPMKQSLLM